MRVNITLEHKESGERLYLDFKNKRNTPRPSSIKNTHQNCVKHVIFTEGEIKIQCRSIERKNATDFKAFFLLIKFYILNCISIQSLPFLHLFLN